LRHRRDFDRVVTQGARAVAGPIQVFTIATSARVDFQELVDMLCGAVATAASRGAP
jgi:hypothetical protein